MNEISRALPSEESITLSIADWELIRVALDTYIGLLPYSQPERVAAMRKLRAFLDPGYEAS